MSVPFSSPHDFTRFTSAGGYVDGEFIDGTSEVVSISCCIQPYRMGEHSIVPRDGGRWVDGMVSIDSDDEIKTDNGLIPGDRLTYNGHLYEVISTEGYEYGLSVDHWEGYAQKINVNTNK